MGVITAISHEMRRESICYCMFEPMTSNSHHTEAEVQSLGAESAGPKSPSVPIQIRGGRANQEYLKATRFFRAVTNPTSNLAVSPAQI